MIRDRETRERVMADTAEPQAVTITMQDFVDGQPTDAADGRTSPIINLSTGKVYAEAPLSGPGDVDGACQVAAAFGTWRDTTPSPRASSMS
jgi:betaine-aldehyde dehydrogenase